jgi:hypothetical protein
VLFDIDGYFSDKWQSLSGFGNSDIQLACGM